MLHGLAAPRATPSGRAGGAGGIGRDLWWQREMVLTVATGATSESTSCDAVDNKRCICGNFTKPRNVRPGGDEGTQETGAGSGQTLSYHKSVMSHIGSFLI
jgi:hypothetical protein